MRIAIEEAEAAADSGEVPVGAVLVKDNEILARTHNRREELQQAYAHAEFLAIMEASKKLGTWCLEDCDLYVTLEPCMMCIGAIHHARIRNLYYGTPDPKGGAADSLIQIKNIQHLRAYPKEIYAGICREECASLLTNFFREKRKKPRKDKNAFAHKE